MTAFLIAIVVFGIACLVSKINRENEFQEKRRLEKTDVALQNRIMAEKRAAFAADFNCIKTTPCELYDVMARYANQHYCDDFDYGSDQAKKTSRECFIARQIGNELTARCDYWLYSERSLPVGWQNSGLTFGELNGESKRYVLYWLSYDKKMIRLGYRPINGKAEQLMVYSCDKLIDIQRNRPVFSKDDIMDAINKHFLFDLPPLPDEYQKTTMELILADDKAKTLFEQIVWYSTKRELRSHGIYAMSPDGVHESWYQELQKKTGNKH